MKAEFISISKVKANPNNPRIIKDDKFQKLVKSIQEFPQMLEIRPIVVNDEMIVLGGNMRLKACQEAGIKEIPIIKASNLTEEQQKEFIIKDNVGFGEWDWNDLANNWDANELSEWGLDIPGFEAEVLEAEEDDFAAPEGGIETDIVVGDLFEIGEHRLLCGDSTDSDQVAKLMNGNKADMVFTDPPYGMAYESNAWDSKKSEVKQKRTDTQILNDENTNVGIDALNLIPLFLNNNRHFYIWCRWDCFNGEWAIFGMIGRRELKERQNGVWQVNRMKGLQMQHPTQKPLEICERGINNSTNTGELIFDLFLGSGSTMVAAHQLKRKCYGMELDPKYCQVIIDRMRKLDPTLVIKKNGLPLE